MSTAAVLVFVILSLALVYLAQKRAYARKRPGEGFPIPPMVWRYRDVEKLLEGGPLPVWLVYGLFVVALVNFAALFVITHKLGGDALNGMMVDGRYYLGNHGKLTEVSREVYGFSLFHTVSVFVTHGVAILTGVVCYRMAQAKRARV